LADGLWVQTPEGIKYNFRQKIKAELKMKTKAILMLCIGLLPLQCNAYTVTVNNNSSGPLTAKEKGNSIGIVQEGTPQSFNINGDGTGFNLVDNYGTPVCSNIADSIHTTIGMHITSINVTVAGSHQPHYINYQCNTWGRT